MSTSDDPQADALEMAKRAQEQWGNERRDADEKRRQAVIGALDQGFTLTEIAEAMGLTRGRVSQIRDGKR